jgi:ABC-type sugar transport system ATPase subunit
MAKLELRHLNKTYSAKVIPVKDLNLDVDDGEFLTLHTPVVYVTHDQTEAMTLSSKVAVLNDGFLQQLDPPRRIYTHPAR